MRKNKEPESPQQTVSDDCIPVIVDDSVIQELRHVLSSQKVDELLRDCSFEVLSRLMRIKGLRQDLSLEGNIDQLKCIAHDLKGVSGNFGLTSLSRVAADLQKITTIPLSTDTAAIGVAIEQVVRTGEQSLVLLGSYTTLGTVPKNNTPF